MERMQSSEIRRRFLGFFVERDHRLYPSSSLVPHNDPTVLLTTAGMQQFITYFTEEAIVWAWEFLTRELRLPPERLWITIFEGDEDAPEDLEAKEHWLGVGVPEHKIFGLPKSENWWGPPGDSGPCGPCSEIYYDYGEEYANGDPAEDPKYGPGGDEGDPRFLEIWTLVFNQYEQRRDGTLIPLAKTGIDTGLGLERTTAVVQGVHSVYETDLYAPIFERVREYTGVEAGGSEATDRTLYLLADHARGMAFLIADGVRPGNQRREYVLRRIIRRATREGYVRLGLSAEQIAGLAEAVVDYMGDFYEELMVAREDIRRIVTGEAARFVEIYESGMSLLTSEIERTDGGHFP